MKILSVRLDDHLAAALERLKIERDVKLSAWIRCLIRDALDPQERATSPPPYTFSVFSETPAPELVLGDRQPPMPGWIQCRLPDGSWGARYASETLPEPRTTELFQDQLEEQWTLWGWIEIQSRGGALVVANIDEVVHRDAVTILVRYTPVPRGRMYYFPGDRAGSESPGGETGRRAGLKILWRFTFRVGSTPTPGTLESRSPTGNQGY